MPFCDRIYNMVENDNPAVNPEEWLEREAGGDEILLEYLKAKEELMTELAFDPEGIQDPFNRKLIQQADEKINSRRDELGMTPMDPTIPYDIEE